MNKEKFLVVISAPSGTGKDTVAGELRKKYPEIEISVSATSRAMRGGEQEGVNYFYLTRSEFEQWIVDGKIVEHTEYCGNYYGTPRSEVDRRIEQGITVLLVIEVEGAGNIKRMYPDATTIFLLPPSMEALEKRLRGRGTETEEQITGRLNQAREEMTHASEYDEQIVNDDLERCVDAVYAAIKKHQQS